MPICCYRKCKKSSRCKTSRMRNTRFSVFLHFCTCSFYTWHLQRKNLGNFSKFEAAFNSVILPYLIRFRVFSCVYKNMKIYKTPRSIYKFQAWKIWFRIKDLFRIRLLNYSIDGDRMPQNREAMNALDRGRSKIFSLPLILDACSQSSICKNEPAEFVV